MLLVDDTDEDDMGKILQAMSEASKFLLDYFWLFNFANVDFIKADVLHNNLPEDWREFLMGEAMTPEILKAILEEADHSDLRPPDSLLKFVRRRNLLLLSTKAALKLETQLKTLRKYPTGPSEKGMAAKKAHEVRRMSNLVTQVIEHTGAQRVVDIGAGLCHLEQALIREVPSSVKSILVFEKDENRLEKAIATLYEPSRNSGPAVNGHVANLDENNLEPVLQVLRDEEAKSVIVGLHACGDLSPCILKMFSESRDISGLVLVQCCFHKTARFRPRSLFFEDSASAALWSPPSLRLASQEPYSRWKHLGQEDHQRRAQQLGLRACLEVGDSKLGSGGGKRHLRKLAKKALEALEAGQVPWRDHQGNEGEPWAGSNFGELCSKHCGYFPALELLTGLQLFLQELLELFVIGDLLLLLFEQGFSPKLVEAFDKSVSPRNYAIVCLKDVNKYPPKP